jgi:hypothetical protein
MRTKFSTKFSINLLNLVRARTRSAAVYTRVYCTGGIRYNLFKIYYFEKLHAPRAARVRARAAREGQRDESIVNNSGYKLKILQNSARGESSLVSIEGSCNP